MSEKRHRGSLQLRVSQPLEKHHQPQSWRKIDGVPHHEIGARVVARALHRHYRRSAIDHHQSEKHQRYGRRE